MKMKAFCFLWVVLLSQVFHHVLNPPQTAHMVKPNQVHSLTSSKTTWEKYIADEMKKEPAP